MTPQVNTVGEFHDAGSLAAHVKELQEECGKLRQSLARVEAEQDHYLHALYANAREDLRFQDVDIPELERNSAGPVQILE